MTSRSDPVVIRYGERQAAPSGEPEAPSPEVAVRNRLDRLDAEVAALAAGRSAHWPDHASRAMPHPAWTCEACGRLLGFIDLERSRIRMRFGRDGYTWTTLGDGGVQEATCPKCGELNRYPRLQGA